MDIVISTSIGAILFLTFVIGLAVSIGSVPFAFIVALVSALMLFDFVQTSLETLKKRRAGNSTNH
ncbi:MAG: hypothetical protein K8F25_08715 [Fimbriimonadaceae bacterium]|nr:hypothetical protein [Alphaproteobacteria bacterium]